MERKEDYETGNDGQVSCLITENFPGYPILLYRFGYPGFQLIRACIASSGVSCFFNKFKAALFANFMSGAISICIPQQQINLPNKSTIS